jgi:hypothetical protein
MYKTETLKSTHNFNDDFIVKNGRISICLINNSPHVFILVESGKHKDNLFIKDNKIISAFSYVPSSTEKYIKKKYHNRKDFYKSNDDNSLTTLSGYNPFLFTKSYIVDTHKLTDKFIRLKSKPIKNWKYNRLKNFNTYNVFSIIPYDKDNYIITDCIGYSNFQYNFAQN